ncbi:MAG: hypothetical protein IIA60_08645 [Candidatus Marinimicrobia bacterium]|nr:hypothetical protein [Candidatus Neomarinimicrobiota bacterium]
MGEKKDKGSRQIGSKPKIAPEDHKMQIIRQAIKIHHSHFARDVNIVGMGLGLKESHGVRLDRPTLTFLVAKKMPLNFLPISRVIPSALHIHEEEIETDVIETGHFYPLAYTARMRPALGGDSIGHGTDTGTLGCLVTDNTDGSTCILSNNHVLADQNNATIGDPILQPGSADGGTDPADRIALLKRFVTIDPAVANQVDAALAAPIKPAYVANQMEGGLAPPSAAHQAVGLLFAGSCNSTILNPIELVENQLNVSLPAGSTVAATVGMNLEKVGRTTEYTTSTVRTINTTVTIGYDMGQVTFNNQIVTAWLSDGGDSGSLVFEGGAGGAEDHCGWAAASVFSALLDEDLRKDEPSLKRIRDHFLRETEGGRVLVDAYYRYEGQTQSVVQRLSETERQQIRKIADRHRSSARQVLAEPGTAEVVFTKAMLKDADIILEIVKQHANKQEFAQAVQLRALANKFAGKTFTEALAMLNDKQIVRRLEQILG